jgi:predicted ATPase/DNA-binding winged helix-turn-helix (wHTH) protein
MPAATEPHVSASNGGAIAFGPYRLLSAQRLLLEGDKPVRLGSRAFDILTALVERAGEVVSKEDLIARTWPETFVDEANLKIQVSALRRALGDGQGDNRYVATVVGRGYNFVASIREEDASWASPSPTIAPAAPHNLPFATTRMLGREEIAATLVRQLSCRRLVTVVGPGGVGKTTIALAVAERMIGTYEHGVWLVDLAPLRDPGLVPSAAATVLGLEIRTEDSLPGLVAALRDNRLLLLLDNCEHVIDAAASLAGAVLSGTSGVNILATSREPLGVSGERVHRLGPLTAPESSSTLTAAEAAAFPAVQLFVERVTAIVEDFTLTDANAPPVVAICRRLDGLPLAIEFAAPRVEVVGVEGLAARLDDSLGRLLTTQRRAAAPRHRTMQAVVDWSYGLLGENEQRFFRALGIFAGGSTVEAAAAVAGDAATSGINAIDRLADLVAKSLIVADVSGAKPRFRLLDTTRAYAIEKLDESGERERVARCHAEYYRNLSERAEREVPTRPPDEWLADYAVEIDNLRAALNWAFSPDGDGSIGVVLTAAADSLWRRLSLLEECRGRVKQALEVLATARSQDPYAEMKLHAALGAATAEATEMSAAFTNALAIAESLGDLEYQLRALGGLYFLHAASSRYSAALPIAQRFHDLAANRPDLRAQPFGEHIVGMAEHYLGDQTSARRHLEQVLTHYVPTCHGGDVVRPQDIIRFQINGHVSARAFLARVLWLQGFSDQAVRTAEMSIEEAQATGHALSLCYALALAACPIALWVGDLTAAAHYTGMLINASRKHGLQLWSAYGSRFQKAVVLARGDIDAGSELLDVSLDEVAQLNLSFRSFTGLSPLVEIFVHAGRMTQGQAVLEGMEQFEAGCYAPELLRLKGELFLLQDTPAAAETAKGLFTQALDEAQRHEALSWALRAATSLARLLHSQDRPADAMACLQPIYDRFTEGFGTADLIAAKQLLDDLGVAGPR